MPTRYHHGPDYDLEEVAEELHGIDEEFTGNGANRFGRSSDMFLSKEWKKFETSTLHALGEYDDEHEELVEVFVRTGNLEATFRPAEVEVDRQHANKGFSADREKAVLQYIEDRYPEEEPYDDAVDDMFE